MRLLGTAVLIFCLAAGCMPGGWAGRGAAARAPAPAPAEVRLALVGDILLTDEVLAGRGSSYPWTEAAPLLRRADLALGNLETAVSQSGEPAPGKQYRFRSHPRVLAAAAKAGMRVLSLANNHTLDYGPKALLETIQNLAAAGITPVGAGRDGAEARRPALIDVQGLKVAVLAFTQIIPSADWTAWENHPGLAAGWEGRAVLAAVAKARAQADVVIVLVHWGEERQETPRPPDVELAGQMIKAGATVVAGHHSHVLQGFQREGGSLVAYSLGNFIFTTPSTRRGLETGILRLTVSREGVTSARFLPMVITDGQPRPATLEDGARIIERLHRLSRPLGAKITADGTILPAN